ncbi:MAG TPA: cytochrome b/b6 domain-containing protein, partial [Agromyces sp.]
MATYPHTLRRGLPRERGGDPWPPQGEALIGATAAPAEAPAAVPVAAAASVATESREVPEVVVASASVAPTRSMRRGLPRVAGGEAWPAAGTMPVAASVPVEPGAAPAPAVAPAPETTPVAP